jgi:cell division protein FtsB
VGRVIVPGLFLAAVYFAVFGGEYSIFELRATRAQLHEEEARLQEVSERIDSLAAQAELLENDPATIERVAREQYGMIRDGETLYRFADAESPGAASGGAESGQER